MNSIILPTLRRDQYEIAIHPAKIKAVCCGRRWGKSVLGGALAVITANMGGRVAWITPTYKNGRALWRWIEHIMGGIKGVKINRSERTVIFPGGGLLAMFSADSPDSIRSENFHLVVIDEAARIAEEVYSDAIMPTVADTNGDILMLTSPAGKNWFYHEFLRCKKLGAAWQKPSSDNPNPNIRRAFKLAKDRVTERAFQQEWLAQFADSGGGVFRNLDEVCIARRKKPYAGRFAFGVDWGKSNDFTVIVCIDLDSRQVVAMDRFNQISWKTQRSRIVKMFEDWQPESIIAEANSIGGPNIEALQNEGLPVLPFTTTAKSKPALIESYVLAIEKNDIILLNDPIVRSEHEAFELKQSATYTRYSAPTGFHDDTVIAHALAWHAAEFGTIAIGFA